MAETQNTTELDTEPEAIELPNWIVTPRELPNLQMGCQGKRTNNHGDDVLVIHVWGWPTDLIRAGFITKAMMSPTGKRLRDVDGDRISLTRYWRLDGRKPRRYCKVILFKPESRALRLPGVQEAVAALARHMDWNGRHCERQPAEKVKSRSEAWKRAEAAQYAALEKGIAAVAAGRAPEAAMYAREVQRWQHIMQREREPSAKPMLRLVVNRPA